MTISSTTRKAGPYVGDDVTTVLPFTFKVFKTADVLVKRQNADGSESTLLESTDYTVALNTNQDTAPGGSVTLAAVLASGTTVTLGTAIAALQQIQLTNQGGFYPEILNGALDRVTILIQQLIEEVSRTLRVPFSDADGGAELGPAADRANRLMGFDADGRPSLFVGAASDSATTLAIDLLNGVSAAKGAAMVGYTQGNGYPAGSVGAWLNNTIILRATPNDSTSPVKTANSAAIQAAIDSFAEAATASLDPSYSVAGEILVLPGTYYFASRLDIKRNVRIRGLGGIPMGNSFGPVRFAFPDTDHGIVIHHYLTSGTGKGADGAVLENISVITGTYAGSGSTPAYAEKHGVWVRTRAQLRGVQTAGWPGNGVQVIATAPGAWSNATTYALGDTASYLGNYYHSAQAGNLNHTPTDAAWWTPGVGDDCGNANSWAIDGLVSQQNGKHGLYVSGADVNAAYARGIDNRSNRRCAIRDDSFLGNTYDAGHAASNGSAGLVTYGGHNWYCLSDTAGAATTPGADATVWGDMGAGSSFSAWSGAGTYYIGLPYYASNANGRSTFYNCYSEGGQGASVFKLPSQVFGGIHAAGNPSGYGLDPTVSTAPFWDADLAGAILRGAHLVPSKGLNFATAKMARSADANTFDAYDEAPTHTVTSSGITTTGTPIYAWRATRLGNITVFKITVGVSGGTNAFTGGTTYVTLPAALQPVAGGVAHATTSAVDQVGICYIDATNGRVYLPTWAASNKTVIIDGFYFVSSTAA